MAATRGAFATSNAALEAHGHAQGPVPAPAHTQGHALAALPPRPLPPRMLVQSLRFLGLPELGRCAAVSRNWGTAANTDELYRLCALHYCPYPGVGRERGGRPPLFVPGTAGASLLGYMYLHLGAAAETSAKSAATATGAAADAAPEDGTAKVHVPNERSNERSFMLTLTFMILTYLHLSTYLQRTL